jgi:hypothetical protein
LNADAASIAVEIDTIAIGNYMPNLARKLKILAISCSINGVAVERLGLLGDAFRDGDTGTFAAIMIAHRKKRMTLEQER